MRTELLTAYAAYKDIPASDVHGLPGSVYYAYQPATGTYWAMAKYEPTSGDSLTVQVGFQDGGSDGFFKKTGTGLGRCPRRRARNLRGAQVLPAAGARGLVVADERGPGVGVLTRRAG